MARGMTFFFVGLFSCAGSQSVRLDFRDFGKIVRGVFKMRLPSVGLNVLLLVGFPLGVSRLVPQLSI